MLRRLLREALFHSHKPRRHHAALLLARRRRTAPRRRAHLLALAERRQRPAGRAGLDGADAGRRRRPARPGRATGRAPSIRPSVRARALVNVGLGGPSPPAQGADDRRAATTTRSRSSGTPPSSRSAWPGRRSWRRFAESEDPETQRGARWWLAQGPAIQDPDVAAPGLAREASRTGRGWSASCRLCATRRPAESQTSQSSSNMPPAMLRVSWRTLSQPGAGFARTCAVSSSVGAQPGMSRSKVTGGRASTTISSEIGSGSRPSTSRNHALSTPRPLGCPTAQPTWSGWKRMSKRSISGAIRRTSSGAIVFGTHCSSGGRSRLLRRGADVVAEAVEVAVRRQRGDPGVPALAQVDGGGRDPAAVAAHVDGHRRRARASRRRGSGRETAIGSGFFGSASRSALPDDREQVAAVHPAADQPARGRGRPPTCSRPAGGSRCAGRTRGSRRVTLEWAP